MSTTKYDCLSLECPSFLLTLSMKLQGVWAPPSQRTATRPDPQTVVHKTCRHLIAELITSTTKRKMVSSVGCARASRGLASIRWGAGAPRHVDGSKPAALGHRRHSQCGP